jgi:predicted nucleic acid-binding protein
LIVIDASAAIELCTELGQRVELRALNPDERLYAPHLLDLEITQVLSRLTHLKEVTAARAHEALDDYSGLLVERAAHRELFWELRDSMTAYDGAYVALAEALDAPLLPAHSSAGHGPGADDHDRRQYRLTVNPSD